MYADELDQVILADFINGASRSTKTAADNTGAVAALAVAGLGPEAVMKVAGGLAALAEHGGTLKEACELFELPPQTISAVVHSVF